MQYFRVLERKKMEEDSPDLGLGDDEDEDEDEYAVVTRILDSFLPWQDHGNASAAMRHDCDSGNASAAADENASNHVTAIVPVSSPAITNEIGDDEKDESAGFEGDTRKMMVMEMQVFVDTMKRKSRRRLKILEQKDQQSPEESEKINKGLETVAMLDRKLQELERRTGDNQHDGRESESNASRTLRNERKKRRRYAKLKRSLKNLDALDPAKQSHLFRNIMLGPSARYFRLTPDEDAMVEELLRQQDIGDDDGDSTSIISHVSTAFDVEGQEAVRLAEIDCRLDPFKESHTHYSTSPMASASTPNSKTLITVGYATSSPMPSVSTPRSKSYVETVTSENKPGSFSMHHELLSKALEPLAGTTVVEDYLGELKERREYEEKMEEIDKKLRQLHMGEVPTALTKEQLLQLVSLLQALAQRFPLVVADLRPMHQLSDSKREQEVYAAIQ